MKTVLAVDDEKLIRWALCEGLREQFVVFTAESVDEAMNILRRARVDAVVTDLNMPDEDGMDFVEILRSRFPEVKVFVLSAYATEPVVHHLLSEGVKACIAKPFSMASLRALLLEHLADEPVEAGLPAEAPPQCAKAGRGKPA